MELNEKIQSDIDRYILKEMSPSELSSFEERLQKEPLLQKEVNLQQTISKAIKQDSRNTLKANINEMFDEEIKKDKPNNSRKKWGGILLLILVISLLTFFFFQSQKQSLEQVFAYTTPQVSITLRGGPADSPILQKANEQFQDKLYKDCLSTLKSYSQQTNPNVLLAEAVCAIELKYNDEAILYLNKLINLNLSQFNTQAHWLLALVNIRKNELGAARKSLVIVANDTTSPYKLKAKLLLEKF